MRWNEPDGGRESTRIASAKMASAVSVVAEENSVASAAPVHLYDQASLAQLLGVSKKTVQNLYSRTPYLLPPAIDIPGARGPRWTAPSIVAWLEGRPAHTSTPAPVVAKRKVGRPRIAAGR